MYNGGKKKGKCLKRNWRRFREEWRCRIWVKKVGSMWMGNICVKVLIEIRKLMKVYIE